MANVSSDKEETDDSEQENAEGEEEEVDDAFDFKEPMNRLMLVNLQDFSIPSGTQIHNSYGNRSNQFLLSNYGLCLPRNKFNYLKFKL